MSRITLNSFDVSAIELELVGYAGVPETVEHYWRQVVILNQILHQFSDSGCFYNLLEGYGADNPGARSQGIKQFMAN